MFMRWQYLDALHHKFHSYTGIEVDDCLTWYMTFGKFPTRDEIEIIRRVGVHSAIDLLSPPMRVPTFDINFEPLDPKLLNETKQRKALGTGNPSIE